jgi:hypothetical protein
MKAALLQYPKDLVAVMGILQIVPSLHQHDSFALDERWKSNAYAPWPAGHDDG